MKTYTFQRILDSWERDETLFSKNELVLTTGINVLIGRNGSGKTTSLSILKKDLDARNIPYLEFEGREEKKLEGYIPSGSSLDDMVDIAYRHFSSEGQSMNNMFSFFCRRLGSFTHQMSNDSEFFVLIDGIDVALDLDHLNEILSLFELISSDYPNAYFVFTANMYELCRNRKCINVKNGEQIVFKDYEEYRDWILKDN